MTGTGTELYNAYPAQSCQGKKNDSLSGGLILEIVEVPALGGDWMRVRGSLGKSRKVNQHSDYRKSCKAHSGSIHLHDLADR